MCTDDTTRAGFIVYEDIFPVTRSGITSFGVLIYRLQRKETHESTEICESSSSVIHLLVVWKYSRSKKLYTDVLLVESDKRFDWNRDSLKELYRKNFARSRPFSDFATEIWSLNDNTALMTTFEIMNEDRIVNIVIYEVERDNDIRMPVRIDPER
jgi:hypothetical protein